MGTSQSLVLSRILQVTEHVKLPLGGLFDMMTCGAISRQITCEHIPGNCHGQDSVKTTQTQ